MWKLKVTPSSVFAFCCFPPKLSRSANWKKKRETESELSVASARKMKRAIQWLIAVSDWKEVWETQRGGMVKYRVNHCTLTFHENLKDDNLARKILSSWLEVAKYRWDVRQYVWKIEPQERGAAHFHLTTNRYMPHSEVRYTWNRALRKMKLANVADNSIDVHAVIEENDLTKYFSDYLTDKEKHEGRRKIKGRRWGCSHDLSNAGNEYVAVSDEEMLVLENELQQFDLRKKLQESKKEIPDFLKFVNYWNVDPSAAGGEIANLLLTQVNALKLQPTKKQLQFWEQT